MLTSTRGSSTLSFGLALGLVLAGCADGDGSDRADAPERPGPLADPSLAPGPPLVSEGEPARIGAVPDVVAVEILSDSGLRIAYTREAQREPVDPRYVGAQWQYMQSCVGIVAQAPLVVIVGGTIEPLIATDDVLRDMEGRITASAGIGPDGIATMQVHEADFDGSSGDPGFSLRSIMGRHLWLSAMLAERDYPFRCARSAAEAGGGTPAGPSSVDIGSVRGQALRPASASPGVPALERAASSSREPRSFPVSTASVPR